MTAQVLGHCEPVLALTNSSVAIWLDYELLDQQLRSGERIGHPA